MVAAPRELLDAVHSLPASSLVEEPGLVVAATYLQRVLIDGDPSRFSHDIRTDELATSPGTPLVQRLILLTGQIATAVGAGDTERALTVVEAARAELASATPEDEAHMRPTLPHLRLQWARAMDVSDRMGAADEYERAYELAQLTDQSHVARRAAAHLAWLQTSQGHLEVGESWIGRAGALESNPRYDAPLYLARALLCIDRNEFESAAVEFARLSVLPVGEYWAASLWVSSMRVRSAVEAVPLHAELARQLDRHSEAEREAPANRRYLRAARLRLSLFRPSIHRASPPDPSTSLDHLVIATEALHRGAYRTSTVHGAEAVDRSHTPRGLASALLVRAAALSSLKQTSHAVDVGLQAQALIDSGRLYSPYRLLPAGSIERLADQMPAEVGARLLTLAYGQRAPEIGSLTSRQTEILRALTDDRPLAEVAASLYISVNTLKSALKKIYGILGVNSRQQAADLARRSGLR
ncbi:LuxR family transcriptional regulator [Labedella phragmitis]|uniref:LuxR family transcriptional regulator n=1 Tax=Labedella phragmitis TaxID=2498849 RepID=A0A3S3ZCT6_9MICO|nr:helix-turn-helix transcriptional regulator [Labedella phragmitis]RWZ52712.1 LuxR family transcriptional regulator [Labedella phragmitis]